jgi:hypothetical protein
VKAAQRNGSLCEVTRERSKSKDTFEGLAESDLDRLGNQVDLNVLHHGTPLEKFYFAALGLRVPPYNNIEALLQAAKDSDLPFIRRYHHSRDGRFALCICQKGTLGDLFDIKAWIDSFKIVSKTIGMQLFSDTDFKEMESLCKKPLLEWLLYLQPPPLSNVQIASLGLVLGHPIQATVSELLNAKK